jgi:hypothetical protein
MTDFNINNYLDYRDGAAVFTGKRMIAYVPMSYQTYGALTVSDVVDAIAIFEIQIDDLPDTHGLFLPAIISMSPSSIDYVTVAGVDYCRCTFTKGDRFLNKTTLVRNSYLAYVLFEEYVHKSRLPKFIKYDDTAFLFDIIKKVTKSKMNVNHAVFEIIFSHLARDKNNVYQYYRLTDMVERPKYLKLDDAAHATISTTAKLTGGYLQDAINGVISNPNTSTSSDIEDLLRS